MKKFRVRYGTWVPFATFKYDKDNKKVLGGIVGDVYEGMKTFLGQFEYESHIQPDNTFGARLPSGSFSGMIGAVFNNETDIAGPFQISEGRSFGVEFTTPLGFSQIGIMSGMVPTNKDPFLIFSIFSMPVWITLFASLALVSATTTLIYHVLPSTEKRPLPEVFAKYFWAFQTSLVDENFGSSDRWFTRHICHSPSFRMLQLLWFIGPGLVLLYSYQGGIISAFAANKFKPKIATVEDLINDKSIGVISYHNAYPQKFFENLAGTKYSSIWARMKDHMLQFDLAGTVPKWMDSVENGENIFTTESTYLRYLVGYRFLKTGKCGIRVSNIDMGSTYIAIGFRKEYHGTDFLKRFNRGLRRFTEGSLAHLRLLHSNLYYDICTGVSSSTTKALGLSDLFGAFIVLGTGITVSILVFFAEVYVSRRSRTKVHWIPKAKVNDIVGNLSNK
ncbi:hypothetical protein JTE90_000450 [Oedothorax gibbosus]|uniref:Ionotropic receptor n=1 Tax=Oedothorax gibbosus TaxID=931172 RepID=A0AAV6UGS7_9ARAC|nr:hypothetical protein JTE90_000450 [Oedothorax gibbosus]